MQDGLISDPPVPKSEGPGAPAVSESWALVFGPAVHSGFEEASVHAGEGGCDFVREEGIVASGDEEFGDAPDVFFGGHPALIVDAGEIDGAGVGAQGALAAEVVVVVEVAEGKFTGGAVYGRTEAESGEVGFGDAAPKSVLAEDCEDVVVIVDSFEVHKERWVAVEAEGCSGEKRAFKAVPLALAEYALRRPGGIGVLIWNFVD